MNPMHSNTVMLVCTFFVVAAVIWHVQAIRYQAVNGRVFDALTFSVYDPTAKVWIALED